MGGAAGVAIGALATAVYASTEGWAVVVALEAWAGGIASAIQSAQSPASSRSARRADVPDGGAADRVTLRLPHGWHHRPALRWPDAD